MNNKEFITEVRYVGDSTHHRSGLIRSDSLLGTLIEYRYLDNTDDKDSLNKLNTKYTNGFSDPDDYTYISEAISLGHETVLELIDKYDTNDGKHDLLLTRFKNLDYCGISLTNQYELIVKCLAVKNYITKGGVHEEQVLTDELTKLVQDSEPSVTKLISLYECEEDPDHPDDGSLVTAKYEIPMEYNDWLRKHESYLYPIAYGKIYDKKITNTRLNVAKHLYAIGTAVRTEVAKLVFKNKNNRDNLMTELDDWVALLATYAFMVTSSEIEDTGKYDKDNRPDVEGTGNTVDSILDDLNKFDPDNPNLGLIESVVDKIGNLDKDLTPQVDITVNTDPDWTPGSSIESSVNRHSYQSKLGSLLSFLSGKINSIYNLWTAIKLLRSKLWMLTEGWLQKHLNKLREKLQALFNKIHGILQGIADKIGAVFAKINAMLDAVGAVLGKLISLVNGVLCMLAELACLINDILKLVTKVFNTIKRVIDFVKRLSNLSLDVKGKASGMIDSLSKSTQRAMHNQVQKLVWKMWQGKSSIVENRVAAIYSAHDSQYATTDMQKAIKAQVNAAVMAATGGAKNSLLNSLFGPLTQSLNAVMMQAKQSLMSSVNKLIDSIFDPDNACQKPIGSHIVPKSLHFPSITISPKLRMSSLNIELQC